MSPEEIDELSKNDLVFQALNWHEDDFVSASGADDDFSEEDVKKQYQIYVHGVTAKGQTVCLRIMNFTPYFYVLIPEDLQKMWTNNSTNLLFKYLKKRLGRFSYGLVTKTMVKKIKMYPFENLRKHKVIRFGFSTNVALKKCTYIFKKPIRVHGLSQFEIKFDLYESNLHSMLRFTHIRDIRMAGWIKINSEEYSLDDGDISRSQINATAHWKDVHPHECNDIAPFIVLSYDLECFSSRAITPDTNDDSKMPDADKEEDYIGQIGVAIWEFGENSTKHQLVFTCNKSDPTPEATIVNCDSEADMLVKFSLFMEREDPDIITGYNIWGFDDKYLWKRMCLHQLDTYIDKMGRIIDIPPSLKEKSLSSGAYGSNTFEIFDMPGRETFDVLIAIRRDHKLESYSLKNVAENFKLPDKIDLSITMGIDTPDTPANERKNPYDLLFEILHRGDLSEVKLVCEYCAHDALLPILLMDKLCYVPNFIEMSKSTRVPTNWLLLRGQQCKAFSQIVYEARLRNFIVPLVEHKGKFDDMEEEIEKKFKGATVLHAMKGAYFDPVAGLDFASLYPSIMIAYNMCHSTIVTDEKYMNLPGIEYHTVSWYQKENDAQFDYTFVQNIKGVLPDILDKLWTERKATKKEMKKHKGTFLAKVLNGKQLAIKVTMNSVYGFCGASKGMLPCRPIAASVTATGRRMISETSTLAQEMYPCVTTYGDSIIGSDKVAVRINGEILKIPIEELYNMFDNEKFYTYHGREKTQKIINNENIVSWTHDGWKKLRRVIKHKCNKKLYKITTDKGTVTVTEDHSLINPYGMQVKPTQLRVGDTLMYRKV